MLKPEELKRLNQISSIRPLIDISLCWGVIAGSLYLCHLSLLFLPVAFILIASRLQALLILMHDGTHNLLNKNDVLNDIISNVFCSFPLQLSTEMYRKGHYPHHQFTQTMKDPYFFIMRTEEAWRFPKPKEEVKKILMKDLLMMTMKDHMRLLKEWQVLRHYGEIGRLEQILFPLFMIAVIGAVAGFGLWKEFLILQASAFFINPIIRVRAMSEHVHRESEGQSKIHKLHETVTVNASWPERFIFSPFNVNRHLEHHTYPTIPYYNLEKAHNIIKNTKLYQEHCLYEFDGYLFGKRTTLNEILSQLPEDSANAQKLKVA